MSAITLDHTQAHKLDFERVKHRRHPATRRRPLPVNATGLWQKGLSDEGGAWTTYYDLLPTQCDEARNWSNEQDLLEAVLLDAILVFRRGLHPTKWGRSLECREAEHWFASHSDSYCFDFEAICLTLHLDAGRIRAKLKKEREGK